MDSDGTCENSQVSALKKWLTLAALTCNWQLKLANFRMFHHGRPWDNKVSQLLINILGQASFYSKGNK